MNATLFLLATAWLPGADPATAGLPPGQLPAPVVVPAPAGPNLPMDGDGGDCKPTLKERLEAFRNPLGGCRACGDAGPFGYDKPTFGERIAAFRNPIGSCPNPFGPAVASVPCVRAANPTCSAVVAAPLPPIPNGVVPVAAPQVMPVAAPQVMPVAAPQAMPVAVPQAMPVAAPQVVPVAATQVVPLDDLAQRIAQEENQLDSLRREYEARQEQLVNLTRHREQLEFQLRQVDQEIAALAHGGALPAMLPAQNAASAKQWQK